MAEIDPVWLQGGNYDASEDRILISALLGAGHWSTTEDLSGVTTYDALKVSANGTPNMSVNVAAGLAIVKGTEATGQGYYIAGNDAGVNRAIAAADNTNARHDIVYLAVRDAQYSGSDSDCVIGVATGIPAAVPADPDIPENAIPLARVVVQANASSITSGNITDRRVASPAWSRPRGRVASAARSSDSGEFTAVTDLGVEVSFTPQAGRLYRLTAAAAFQSSVAGDHIGLQIATSANTVVKYGLGVAAAVNRSATIDVWRVVTGSVPITYKLRAERLAGTGNITLKASSTFPAELLVEDIGGFI